LQNEIFLIEKEIFFWGPGNIAMQSMDFPLFIYNSERRKKMLAFTQNRLKLRMVLTRDF